MREMGMDMRERLARAIGETKCNGTSLHQMTTLAAHAAGVRWEEDKFSASMLTIADAVLAALMEPTPEMIQSRIDRYPSELRIRESDLEVWRDMINAAAK